MERRNRYKDFERATAMLLLVAALDFVIYLICAFSGVLWLQIITAIIAILLPAFCLLQLYLTQEILKQRSLWLTTGFGGIFLCTLVSILVNYP